MFSKEPMADPSVRARESEKSDLHSRGGRFSNSLTSPGAANDVDEFDCGPNRESSLSRDDELESPENGVREREDARLVSAPAPNEGDV